MFSLEKHIPNINFLHFKKKIAKHAWKFVLVYYCTFKITLCPFKKPIISSKFYLFVFTKFVILDYYLNLLFKYNHM